MSDILRLLSGFLDKVSDIFVLMSELSFQLSDISRFVRIPPPNVRIKEDQLSQEYKVQNENEEQTIHNRMNLFRAPLQQHRNRIEDESDRNSRRNTIR